MQKHALVVPVKVHAFVTDSFVQNETNFNRFQMEYGKLNQHLSPEPKAYPDSRPKDQVDIGVYLHWHLPAGLTEVKKNPDGTMEYPIVPNRWMVVRKITSGSNTQTMAWIVTSDERITDNRNSDGSPFCRYNERTSRIETFQIGKKHPLSSWNGDRDPDKRMYLTAGGAGDVTFSFFQPNCNNVFSIHDPLLDQHDDEILEAEVDYSVLGWYSNSRYDPLNQASAPDAWRKIADEYGWQAADQTTYTITSTFFSGGVQQVKWKRDVNHLLYPSHVNPNQKVVVGLTSVDAMAELLGSYNVDRNEDIDRLLEAYQYNQLRTFDEPGEEETLEESIHKSGFHSSCGGTVWVFEDREDKDQTMDPSRVQRIVRQEEEMLADLNRLQVRLDKEKRKLETIKQHAYELWWKFVNRIPDHHPLEELSRQQLRVDRLEYLVQEHMEQIIQHQRHHNSPKKLTHSAMPRFWSPKDPVVMIAGLQKSSLEPDQGNLLCTILTYTTDTTYNCMELKLDRVPQAISALLCEHQDTTGFPVWTQPWLPLFLEWEVVWTPILHENWSFDGYDRNAKASDHETPDRIYKGRTLLGPHAIFSLKDRLCKFASGLAEKPPEHVYQFIDHLTELDVLSQTLGGLQHLLLQRDTRMHPLPDESWVQLNKLLGDQPLSMPDADSFDHGDFKYFQPYRSGQFVIKRMRVIDGFGRVEDIPLSLTHWDHSPMISEALRTENEELGVAELKPRLMQGARLNYNWASTKTGKDIQLEAGSSPVYGWVLPNHLDRGLAIFNPKGEPLGQIRFKGRIENRQEVAWYAAPDTNYDTPDALRRTYPALYQFVKGILDSEYEGFGTLMSVIDETSWVIDLKNRLFDQSMAAYIGRPLVLANAKLSLEMYGAPMSSVQNLDHRYLDKKFEVNLGNIWLKRDGLLGFYKPGHKGYSRFYSVAKPCFRILDGNGKPACAKTDYVQQIGTQDEAYVKLSLNDSRREHNQYITMLMDPFAKVYARSGCLPWKEIELPQKFKQEALQRIQVYFNAGPLLTTKKCGVDKDDYQLLLPKPGERFGKWHWKERSNSAKHEWTSYPIKDQDQKDMPTRENPTVREGLFQLTPFVKQTKDE
ncbi:hypothetical protein NST38_31425 [Paenibacillus sp. FSL H8-0104]|uniref:hypothetical protein n=1 Tax=Paenibacillus sp. FSL H8-0104 TaxID=2954509 RepID=UPI0030FD9B77